MVTTYTTGDNNYGVATLIVDGTAGNGNYTTIASALTAASSGQTIFIRPGTYTENLTLKAGVDLVSFEADAITPNVIISGNATATFAGTCSISGICLQTNSGNLLTVSGSSATIVNLKACNLNCTNNTGISYTSSSSSSQINLFNCTGDLGTTLIGLFTMTSTGAINCYYSRFTNSGSSVTASTLSAGTFFARYSYFEQVFSSSSTGRFSIKHCNFPKQELNTTYITTAGTTANHAIVFCDIASGTASCISIGSGTTMGVFQCNLFSSNTNVVAGSGTFNNGGNLFTSTSSGIATGLTRTIQPFGDIMQCNGFVTKYTATATDYTVLITDCIIGVTNTGAARTITMPSTGMTTGQMWRIKDESVGAASHNITIQGNGANIIGSTSAASYTINTNGGSVDLYWNGTAFGVV